MENDARSRICLSLTWLPICSHIEIEGRKYGLTLIHNTENMLLANKTRSMTG